MIAALTPRERDKLRLIVNARQTVDDVFQYYTHGDDQFDRPELEGFWFDWDKLVSQCMPDVGVVLSASRRTAQVEYVYPVFAVIFRTGDWFQLSTDEQMKSVLRHAEVDDRGIAAEAVDTLRQIILTVPSDRRGEAMKHLEALQRIIKPVL
jgi:hypothetical protein